MTTKTPEDVGVPQCFEVFWVLKCVGGVLKCFGSILKCFEVIFLMSRVIFNGSVHTEVPWCDMILPAEVF